MNNFEKAMLNEKALFFRYIKETRSKSLFSANLTKFHEKHATRFEGNVPKNIRKWSMNSLDPYKMVMTSFIWSETNQGWTYWSGVKDNFVSFFRKLKHQ